MANVVYVDSFDDMAISKGCINMTKERLGGLETAIIAVELEIENNGALPVKREILAPFLL